LTPRSGTDTAYRLQPPSAQSPGDHERPPRPPRRSPGRPVPHRARARRWRHVACFKVFKGSLERWLDSAGGCA